MSPEWPRVGYVINRYPCYSETFIVNEIVAQESAGMEIELFSLRPPADGRFQDCLGRVRAPAVYVPGGGAKGADFWASIEQLAAVVPGIWESLAYARGEDVKHVHQALMLALLAIRRKVGHLHAHFASGATTVARLAARFAGIPFSFTAHAKDIFHESVSHADMNRKLRDAQAVVTVSDYNVAHLQAAHGAAAASVVRVYNGLNLEEFAYRDPQPAEPNILAVGRLVEKKGFADLIAACALLVAEGRSFTCRIVGDGDQAADLRDRIARLGLEGVVELLGGRPQREVFSLMRDAAVFACPCVVGRDGNRDGLPTVLLEAMALGLPCVSTPVTGIPELVAHEVTGLLTPEGDPPALARALARLLDDAALRTALARQARRRIEEDFDIHVNAARIRELLFNRSQYVNRAQGLHAIGA